MSNRLEVKIDGNASGFKNAMDDVRKRAQGTAQIITHSWTGGVFANLAGGIVGAFSFEGVKSSLESFLGRAKEIKDLSEQFDMSADAVQRWQKAADKAGLSASAAFNAISSIQSKRQEALRDPKAADLFSGLGISRDEVLHGDNSEFAQRVLLAGGSSDEKRATLEQIVGRRGLKVVAAAKGVGEMEPDLGPDAIKAADDVEKASKKVNSLIGRKWGEIIENYAHMIDFLKGDLSLKDWAKKGVFLVGHKFQYGNADTGSTAPKQNGSIATIDELIKFREDEARRNGQVAPGAGSDASDPLTGIKNQQQQEFQLRKEEADLSLHEAERRNMTIAARKKSIKTDISALDKEIDERKKAGDAGLIYGMTKSQQAELLPSDIEKQLQTDQLALTGLRGKKAGLTNELRSGTNFNLSADSLARVGLFSSSSLSINPMLQLGQKQIHLLDRIEHNTSQRLDDPHRR